MSDKRKDNYPNNGNLGTIVYDRGETDGALPGVLSFTGARVTLSGPTLYLNGAIVPSGENIPFEQQGIRLALDGSKRNDVLNLREIRGQDGTTLTTDLP